MKGRKYFETIIAVLGMTVLILDGKTAVRGIQEGINLCMKTMIPSLFPFLVISSILTATLNGQAPKFIQVPLSVFRIPENAGSLLLTGLLGGYPIGAKSVADALRNGQISESAAKKQVILCNNAGPAFIFGVLGSIFPDRRWVVVLWLAQVGSVLLTAILLGNDYDIKSNLTSNENIDYVAVVHGAVRSMAMICGWVILFRMILEFLTRWVLWILPVPLYVLMTGLMELSNGCILLSEITDETLRLLLAAILISMGGLSVLMQTKSVFPQLCLKDYLRGKLLQCGICTGLVCLFIPFLTGANQIGAATVSVMLIFLFIFRVLTRGNSKKEVAIP